MSGHEFVTTDEIEELKLAFEKFEINKSGEISNENVVEALAEGGEKVAGYQCRQLIAQLESSKEGFLTWNEFLKLFSNIRKNKDQGFRKQIKQVDNVKQVGGSHASAEGTTHSVGDVEKIAFVDWINRQLSHDNDLKQLKIMPVSEKGNELFEACSNGVLLAKLINIAVHGTIDERALNIKKINVYTILENQTLVINSAKAVGVNVVNIGAQDLVNGVPYLVLGIIWQIIRIGLLGQVNLQACPGLVRLLEEDETIEHFMSLPAEKILLRWFNYHLQQSGHQKRIKNFSSDIQDSEAYTVLLKQIAPPQLNVNDSALFEKDHIKRAEIMLDNAEKMDCRRFLRPCDVVSGHPKLNLAFIANLFNTFPGLDPVETEEAIIEESREEKTFRNWMNSLGVNPFVNNLYQDLNDGIVILQLFDKVYPGYVDWKLVNQPPFKVMSATMKKIENANYVLELGKGKKFSLVGIDGKDIFDGGKTPTLALIWQLMRAYTLEILKRLSGDNKPISDNDIISWVNKKLASSNKKSNINSFKDSNISISLPVIDLVDAIKPGSIDYSLVLSKPVNPEEKMLNASYAITMSRKIGANIYALPEDLVEVNQKMVMTIFACLMASSFS